MFFCASVISSFLPFRQDYFRWLGSADTASHCFSNTTMNSEMLPRSVSSLRAYVDTPDGTALFVTGRLWVYDDGQAQIRFSEMFLTANGIWRREDAGAIQVVLELPLSSHQDLPNFCGPEVSQAGSVEAYGVKRNGFFWVQSIETLCSTLPSRSATPSIVSDSSSILSNS